MTDALFNNIFESHIKLNDILKHGNFGIGTLDSFEGEMVIYEKKVYTAKGDGNLYKIDPESKTPFAIVADFKPEISFNFENISYSDLLNEIFQRLKNKNLLFSIKIEGVIKSITLKCHDKQTRPYKEFKEIVEESKAFNYSNIRGILVGFRLPSYIKGINLSGFHFHFVDDERKIGGHVYDCMFESANVEISIHDSFFVELNNHEDFENVDFEKKIDVEKLLDSEFKTY